MSTTAFTEYAPLNFTGSINNASGTTAHTLTTAQTGRYRVDECYFTNFDSIAHVINVSLTVGGTRANFASVNVPAGAGTGGVPAVEAVAAAFPAGAVGAALNPTDTLQLQAEVALTGATTLSYAVFGGLV